MFTMIVPKSGSMTGYNTETCRVNPVSRMLIHCGEHVFKDPFDRTIKRLYGKDRDGTVWEVLWSHQYKIIEKEKLPWLSDDIISSESTTSEAPASWYQNIFEALSKKISYWIWYWTPQGFARDFNELES